MRAGNAYENNTKIFRLIRFQARTWPIMVSVTAQGGSPGTGEHRTPPPSPRSRRNLWAPPRGARGRQMRMPTDAWRPTGRSDQGAVSKGPQKGAKLEKGREGKRGKEQPKLQKSFKPLSPEVKRTPLSRAARFKPHISGTHVVPSPCSWSITRVTMPQAAASSVARFSRKVPSLAPSQGFPVGAGVGAGVGAELGPMVGAGRGTSVGPWVGTSEGSFVGRGVGAGVGCGVGAGLGVGDGWGAGFRVGGTVGTGLGGSEGSSEGCGTGLLVGLTLLVQKAQLRSQVLG